MSVELALSMKIALELVGETDALVEASAPARYAEALALVRAEPTPPDRLYLRPDRAVVAQWTRRGMLGQVETVREFQAGWGYVWGAHWRCGWTKGASAL